MGQAWQRPESAGTGGLMVQMCPVVGTVFLSSTEFESAKPVIPASYRKRTRMRMAVTIKIIPNISNRVVFSRKKNTDAINVKTSSICPTALT